uniref:Uncharacterized protein n=1 Tax=Anguilla anguilla TaxID=7936 RepID=A0A0E9TRN7_ANGAN
MTSHRYSVP